MIGRLLVVAPPRTLTATAMALHAIGLGLVVGAALALREPVYWYGLALYGFAGPCAIVSAKRGAYAVESTACYLEATVLFAGTLAAISNPAAPTQWPWWEIGVASLMFVAFVLRAQVVSYLRREKEADILQDHIDRISQLKKGG